MVIVSPEDSSSNTEEPADSLSDSLSVPLGMNESSLDSSITVLVR